VLRITKSEIYPQPVNPMRDEKLLVDFTATQRCSRVLFVLYTAAYRRIIVKEIGNNLDAGEHKKVIDTTGFRNLANGTYYWMIEAEGKAGQRAAGRVNVLIVLKGGV